MLLPKVEMNADNLLAGAKYIWRLDEGRHKIVWLSEDGEGLDEEEDTWYFKDNLIGALYGPFDLAL